MSVRIEGIVIQQPNEVEKQALLTTRQLRKSYGNARAVDDVQMDVFRGEVLVILGPSGCGKSTLLRLLAGLESADFGEISLRGEVLVDGKKRKFVPAEKRNFGMVFQSYAIWPHMTVAEHIAFPLQVRRFPKREVDEKVKEAAALVGLQELTDRLATQLSGGQQQRMALARALVYKPDVLLLDEPLSNLDTKIREELRLELKNLQATLGTTIILVTHDQDEAMSLGSRIAVMHSGRFEQVGTPEEIYQNPKNLFVQSFLGPVVSFPGRWSEGSPDAVIELDGGSKIKIGEGNKRTQAPDRGRVLATTRPNELKILPWKDRREENELDAVVERLTYLGDRWQVVLTRNDTRFSLESRELPAGVKSGNRVVLSLNPATVKTWQA